MSLGFSLGVGVAGAVVGMLGFGLFTSGGVGLYQCRQAQDFKDQDLSQHLSALSVRLAPYEVSTDISNPRSKDHEIRLGG